jgi:membrane associated rhomboid family serine protease
MKLIPQWRRWWRMNSVQVFGLIAALIAVWTQLPPDVQAMIPENVRGYILIGIAIGGAILRLRDQGITK